MTYDINYHLTALIPSKASKTKYHCPVCGGNDLDIGKGSPPAYSCFSSGCTPKDIRAAIDKLEGKPEWKPEKFTKKIKPKSEKDYYYPDRNGNLLIKVTRKDDGEGNKSFPQRHWNGKKWIIGNPTEIKKSIPIYRYVEIQAAIDREELIFWVEGEATADSLWELGIPATTTIGGSAGYKAYGDYLDDLESARLIIAPDRDKNGLKYISNIIDDFSDSIEGYYLAGSQGLWKNPEGGMDIANDIEDHSLSKEEILEKIISKEEYLKIFTTTPLESKVDSKFSHFNTSYEGGLVKISIKKNEDGEDYEQSQLIGNHLEAIAYVNNPERDEAALQLEFKSIYGEMRQWTMPRSDLAREGVNIIAGLMSRDYTFKRNQKSLLLNYLHELGSKIANTYTVTNSSGWVGKSFVLPHKTHGDENLKFRDIIPSPESITELKGTLIGWKTDVAAKCSGNSRLIMALGISFAAPLLPIVDIESGGFHLVGVTSQGKTTILSVAASVTGIKDIPHWRTTTNGLESTATAFNHLCLPLDEIHQADARDVGNIAYMLANGQGKARMKRDLARQKTQTWRLMVLSSGEVGLGEYMKQANIEQKGGQEVRLPDVPAIPHGHSFGCFENIHSASTAKIFVKDLERAVKNNHGVALDDFLWRLIKEVDDPKFAGILSERLYKIAAGLTEGLSDTAIGRIAKRFALVQVALELAHSYDLLPFPINEIDWAIKTIFDDWLAARGGDGSMEIKRAVKRIEHLLISNEFSDRIYDLRDGDDNKVRNLLAYRKVNGMGNTEELWVPTAIFDKEFCEGINKSELVSELQRLKLLLPPRPDGRATHTRSLNGKRIYFYIFQSLVFSMEQVEQVEQDT